MLRGTHFLPIFDLSLKGLKIKFLFKTLEKYKQVLTKEHLFCTINIGGNQLHIKKTYYYDAIIYNNNLAEKARDDSFEPTTISSEKYNTWHAVLDHFKTFYEII